VKSIGTVVALIPFKVALIHFKVQRDDLIVDGCRFPKQRRLSIYGKRLCVEFQVAILIEEQSYILKQLFMSTLFHDRFGARIER
jgi:hypothetical protein